MKDISLIPFVVSLIGFDNCLKESPDVWKFGPEYTFRVGVDSSIQFNDADKYTCSNMTIILKCRPFISESNNRTDSLQCYIKESENQNFYVNQSSSLEKSQENEPMPHEDIKEPKFELFFHKKGMKKMKIDSSIEGWRLNLIRLLISGFYEYAFFSNCMTYTTASEQIKIKPKQWTTKCGDKVQLGFHNHGSAEPIIGINVTQKVENCSQYIFYLLKTQGTKESELPRSSLTKSRITSLYIAPHSFEFSSQHESHRFYSNNTSSGPNFESLCLLLESIEPASLEFKRLSIPSTTITFTDIKDLAD